MAADRLTRDEQRLRTAIRAHDLEAARRIWRKIEQHLADSATRSRRSRTGASDGSVAPVPAERLVPLARLAQELGVDPRTLARQTAGKAYVYRLGPRTVIIDRAAYLADVGVRRPAP
jgi:hypothetical protein